MKIQVITLPDDLSGINMNAMSYVTEPAIELESILLSKEIPAKYNLSKPIDHNRILSYALVPNKIIPRVTANGEVYYIMFPKDDVKKLAYHYMMTSQKFSIQHESKVSDCYVIENWIVEDKNNDKTNFYNYPAIDGGWVMMSQVNNDIIMNKFRTGELRGLSMELNIAKQLEKYGKISKSVDLSEKEIKVIKYLDKSGLKYDYETIQKIMKL